MLKIFFAQQTLALVHSTAEYSDPAWCHCNITHFIVKIINEALRMVTDCPRIISANSLPVLMKTKKTAIQNFDCLLVERDRTP